MKRSTFDAIVGFLQGVFWAFLLIGAWITFHVVSLFFGTGLALFAATLYVCSSLFALLLLETVRIFRKKADDEIRRTELLEEIRNALNREADG